MGKTTGGGTARAGKCLDQVEPRGSRVPVYRRDSLEKKKKELGELSEPSRRKGLCGLTCKGE